jgi:hypothetical protein
MARQAKAWFGVERHGYFQQHRTTGSTVRLRDVRITRYGLLRHGLERLGTARHGMVRLGFSNGFPVRFRREDSRGGAGQAWVWRGSAWYGMVWHFSQRVSTMVTITKNGKAPTAVGPVSNDAKDDIELLAPYLAVVRIRGTADILFHRWSCEAVDEKAKAAKGSKTKKTDNIESYVSRNDEGEICIPGEYLRGAIIGAAKFRQDPRSPRKSAMDLFKAAVVSMTPLATLGKKTWDYEDRRRVQVQRAGITRTRPAFKSGWEAEFEIMVTLPQYVSPETLNEVISEAGRVVGIADFRPTYGRFQVVKFETSLER